jgi:hypothetical protein
MNIGLTRNFIMGGKLGDFILSMYAVKNICERDSCKANIYMYDIGWEFGIRNTHAEMLPIMIDQDYVNSFNVMDECEIDSVQHSEKNSPVRVFNSKLLSEGFIDLGGYIRSPLLYKNSWSEIYANLFNFDIKNDYSWITHNKEKLETKDRILIHRKFSKTLNHEFPYDQIINEYKDQILFISSNEKDYFDFPYKDRIEFLKVSSIEDWFSSINSCAMLVSNLSAPITIAHALNKLRIAELPNNGDLFHWVGESKYCENIKWFLNDQFNNLK